jgi:hypothetical protein
MLLKQQVETLDASGQWEYLKRTSNPYELVFSQCQDERVPPSVCSLRPLSRSFFKMAEMLYVLEFFKRHKVPKGRKQSIKSAHVCEGPGGFIEALTYLSERNSWTVESAWAMTLRPVKANIPGWKRAFHFLRKSPMVHIEYGADDTGDILVPENQAAFLQKAGGKCAIFTADGGFDFSDNYANQEEDVYPLLVSSALIGLQTLVVGGDFILKIFDTELECTRHFLIALASCFESWTLYKPALSRPCNAEKYFLGKGFRTAPKEVLSCLRQLRDGLREKSESHISRLFPMDQQPREAYEFLQGLHAELLRNQEAALDFAIQKRAEWESDPKPIWRKIHDASVTWCKQFQMPLKAFTALSL